MRGKVTFRRKKWRPRELQAPQAPLCGLATPGSGWPVVPLGAPCLMRHRAALPSSVTQWAVRQTHLDQTSCRGHGAHCLTFLSLRVLFYKREVVIPDSWVAVGTSELGMHGYAMETKHSAEWLPQRRCSEGLHALPVT